ncbi:MAG: hypothetical protein ACFFB5_06420 [Promethearchaeota archaeon]
MDLKNKLKHCFLLSIVITIYLDLFYVSIVLFRKDMDQSLIQNLLIIASMMSAFYIYASGLLVESMNGRKYSINELRRAHLLIVSVLGIVQNSLIIIFLLLSTYSIFNLPTTLIITFVPPILFIFVYFYKEKDSISSDPPLLFT